MSHFKHLSGGCESDCDAAAIASVIEHVLGADDYEL
jgi:hypothetical protein